MKRGQIRVDTIIMKNKRGDANVGVIIAVVAGVFVIAIILIGVVPYFRDNVIGFFKNLGGGNETGQVGDGTISKPTEEYIRRYNELKPLFEKYSQQNLPFDWNRDAYFKPLLVAIAQSRSDLGSPSSDWLMGYGIGIAKYKGAENQISYSSADLKSAIQSSFTFKVGTSFPYKDCSGLTYDNKIECVIRVYTGPQGADNAIEYYHDWKKYFTPTISD